MASKFGGVEDGGYRFRIHIKVSGKDPEKIRGPWRQDHAQAHADLAEARRCCTTREEMYEFVAKLAASQTLSGLDSSSSDYCALPQAEAESAEHPASTAGNLSMHSWHKVVAENAACEVPDAVLEASPVIFHPLVDVPSHTRGLQEAEVSDALAAAQKLKTMGKDQLRRLAGKTAGVTWNKKTSAGKWISKSLSEIIAALAKSGNATTHALPEGSTALPKKLKQNKRQRGKAYTAKRLQTSWQMAKRLAKRRA